MKTCNRVNHSSVGVYIFNKLSVSIKRAWPENYAFNSNAGFTQWIIKPSKIKSYSKNWSNSNHHNFYIKDLSFYLLFFLHIYYLDLSTKFSFPNLLKQEFLRAAILRNFWRKSNVISKRHFRIFWELSKGYLTSAMVGWIPMSWSKSALVAPIFMPIPKPWVISPALGDKIWKPTTFSWGIKNVKREKSFKFKVNGYGIIANGSRSSILMSF